MTDAPNSPDELATGMWDRAKALWTGLEPGDALAWLRAECSRENTPVPVSKARLRLILSRLASQEETIRADGEALLAIKTGPGVECIPDNDVQAIVSARLSARQEGQT